MNKEQLQRITEKVKSNNPMGVVLDREELLDAFMEHLKAFEAIVKALVHGRNVAKDIQEAVKIASEQLGEPVNPFHRDCSTDPDVPNL